VKVLHSVAPIVIGSVVGGFMLSGTFQKFLGLEAPIRDYFVFLFFGEVRFVAIALTAILIILLYKKQFIAKGTMKFLFILICVLDLVAFNAHYSNIVAPPPARAVFYAQTFPYRDMDPTVRDKLDLVNYRGDALHRSRVNSNKNLIFEVPSYSGILGYMPKRFWKLATTFGYPQTTILIYPNSFSNSERFLDLSAVRYRFINEYNFAERPTALARLNVLYDYKVIEDDEGLLEELQSSKFNPRMQVLLSKEPKGLRKINTKRFGQPISITRATSDYIFTRINARQSSILLFSESFDNGWKAYIDGEEVPVYRANYNFMACVLPKGNHTVEFKYLPSSFFVSLKISMAGLFILIFMTIYLFIRDLKRKQKR